MLSYISDHGRQKETENPNGLILGTPGAGKSFAAKREITNAFIVTKDDIIVCDPEGEYYPLFRAFHGQVIRISPTSMIISIRWTSIWITQMMMTHFP